MSKTVTIPSDVSRLEVEINRVHYSYKGGDTVTVPDEVAALLADNLRDVPTDTRPVHSPLAAENKKGDKAGVPVMTDESGNLYADADAAAAAALGKIYVDGHKAVIPQADGG